MRSPDAKELRDHATIGGAIALALTLFEYCEHQFVPRLWASKPLLVALELILVVLSAFVLAYAFIVGLEVLRRRAISLADVGPVDGYWIYIMCDADSEDYNRGSVVRISSSGLEFEMEGYSYSRDELVALASGPAEDIRPGHFRGRGSQRTGNSIHYYYRGREARDDEGVGFYAFDRRADGEMEITGAFTGFLLGRGRGSAIQTRSLVGRKLTEIETQNFQQDQGRAALLKLLKNSLPNQYSFEGIGAVDGYWVDVIYSGSSTKTELIEGSVVKIASSLASRRFTIEGDTYGWDKDKKEIKWRRSFTAEGHPMVTGKGIYYGSTVTGREAGPQGGVGYYRFVKGQSGVSLVGAFLLGPRDDHRIVLGEQLSEAAWNKDQGRERLRQFLEQPPEFLW
jgi:hypothetical protein